MPKCGTCNGKGKAYSTALKQYVTCDGCAGRGQTFEKCSGCRGTGKQYSREQDKYFTCSDCRGAGQR